MSEKRSLSIEEIAEIEGIIGYTFNNKNLLQQAFTRSSYVNEHKEAFSNEVLEFYGDRVLDIVVTKELSKRLGSINENGQYATQFLNGYETVNEGYLSMLRSKLVCKGNLDKRTRALGLDEYLIKGKSDSEVTESMNEDLFEAVCGAMAIDSNWSLNKIEASILIMLNFEDNFYVLTSEDPVIKYFLEWYRRHFDSEPSFHYAETLSDNWEPALMCVLIIANTDDKNKLNELWSNTSYKYRYEGYGLTQYDARRDAIIEAAADLFENEKVYDIFPDNDLNLFKKNWLNPTLDNSINIVQEIEQAKLIKDLSYQYNIESNDDNGNPIWSCEGSFAFNTPLKNGWNYKRKIKSEDFKNKTEAKKHVALELIRHIFETFHISFPE